MPSSLHESDHPTATLEPGPDQAVGHGSADEKLKSIRELIVGDEFQWIAP